MSANVEPPSHFKERSAVTKRCSIPKRYVQALLASFALFIPYWMRTSFLAALITFLDTRHNTDEEVASWIYSDITLIDSAFNWGFTAAQIPSALLAIKYSCHRVLLVSMVATVTFHVTLPFFMMSNSAAAVIFIRLLQGIAEGPLYPACIGIWKLWAPPSERTTLFSIVLCGSFFGSVVGLPLNLALANNFGAKACFFASSIAALGWCLLWLTQTHENPSSHPHISHYELTYLEENVDVDSKLEVTVKSIPWKSILLSLPVWTICLANFCYFCSEYVLVISPYLYYRFEMAYEMQHTLLDVLLPNIILGVIVAMSGLFADFLINKVHFSREAVRKLYCSGAFTLHGITFLIIRYFHGIELTIIFLNIAHGLLGLALTGFMVNCLDLSAYYASVVMAFVMTFGSLGDVIFAAIVRELWSYSEDLSDWFRIFDTLISISFITALIYGVLGSGDTQWWGKPDTARPHPSQDESSRSTYYSYPDGADCVELVMDTHEPSNDFTEIEKGRY